MKPCLILCWFRALLQDYSAITPPISASNNLHFRSNALLTPLNPHTVRLFHSALPFISVRARLLLPVYKVRQVSELCLNWEWEGEKRTFAI